MALPQENKDYGTKAYWDARYTQESSDASFDWFKSYSDLKPHICDLIPDKNARVLMLGCGNSKFSEEMYDDGYKNIVNIDYSSVVIRHMQERHATSRPEMQWREMDVRNLSEFEDSFFDIAIDKGTMDAMMTSSSDVWDPPEQVIQDCTAEVKEVLRVLKKPSGIFLYITFGQPHFRRRYLSVPNTTLKIKELGEMFHYYMYILRV
ncbi:S-adenosyl-L-methionine-dependent methyltransferase [Hygrophoropsis aurantiaca]|uniref:S-adenosyl-L-methionine-dependent methyltransferase n=1 Tax=Hygrophoropsis aurantiaca TaxID=72124 RepID=A0ACB8ALN0_9AGAM|nr:S-adenosyl-L-methionine-dependent methyltransferase [Hygrophoropsis aurantiaca]